MVRIAAAAEGHQHMGEIDLHDRISLQDGKVEAQLCAPCGWRGRVAHQPRKANAPPPPKSRRGPLRTGGMKTTAGSTPKTREINDPRKDGCLCVRVTREKCNASRVIDGRAHLAIVPTMPNQRALAAALGLSQTTVTRALRGSPQVKPETLQRVQEAARKLGYRPNPMVTTLMEHIRSGKEMVNQGSIAILIDAESDADAVLRQEAYRLQREGFVRRAQLRGYNTEIIYLKGNGITCERLDQIFYTRGFAGIILAAPDQGSSLQFKWERYALASVSYDWSQLSIDRAASDLRYNTHLAFDELKGRGYERIGLALPTSALNSRDRNWLGAYLACQYDLPKSRQIPVFIGSVPEGSEEKFRCWHAKWKPDALLCLQGEEHVWVKQHSPKDEMALVCLNRPTDSDFTGVEENNVLVGEMICDLVVNHIIHNERGMSVHPRLILVKGNWKEGKTLSPREAPAQRGDTEGG